MDIGVDPGVIGWAAAFAVAAGVVALMAERWSAALADSPGTVRVGSPWRIFVPVLGGLAVGVLLGSRGAGSGAMAWSLLIAAFLLLVALIDLRTRLIPVATVAALILVGFSRAAIGSGMTSSVIGALVGGAVFALLWVAALPLRARVGTTPFGVGDVLLAAGIGAVVGWPFVLPTLFLGAVFGAVGAIVLLATGSARASDAIPYGVFLCAATLVAEVAGH